MTPNAPDQITPDLAEDITALLSECSTEIRNLTGNWGPSDSNPVLARVRAMFERIMKAEQGQ